MGPKRKILLIDDHDSVLKLLEAVLKVRNYDVCYASSGAEGLEMAQRETPDLILLDIMMPGMDGFKVCQALKQSEATKSIPKRPTVKWDSALAAKGSSRSRSAVST